MLLQGDGLRFFVESNGTLRGTEAHQCDDAALKNHLLSPRWPALAASAGIAALERRVETDRAELQAQRCLGLGEAGEIETDGAAFVTVVR